MNSLIPITATKKCSVSILLISTTYTTFFSWKTEDALIFKVFQQLRILKTAKQSDLFPNPWTQIQEFNMIGQVHQQMHRIVNKMSTAIWKILVNFQFNLILEFKEIFGVSHSSFVKTYTKPPKGLSYSISPVVTSWFSRLSKRTEEEILQPLLLY